MKQAAVQSSAAGSAAVNSSLNDSDSMIPAVSECEQNAESRGPAVLEQRREHTRHHLAKIAARRESWISRNSQYCGLLIALEVTWFTRTRDDEANVICNPIGKAGSNGTLNERQIIYALTKVAKTLGVFSRNWSELANARIADPFAARDIAEVLGRLSKIGSLGQVAEWLKAAARKGCYTTQVVSEVRILPLSAYF